jgi:hypothetical protein
MRLLKPFSKGGSDMNKFSMILATITCCISAVFAQTPQRPFPQAGKWSGGGEVIKPSNRTQEQLNQDVIERYNDHKSRHLVAVDGGNFYMRIGGTVGGRQRATQSEAHGYGMIIFALMAGYDPDAKTIFDGMNRLRRAHSATNESRLMSWEVFPENLTATGTPALPESERRRLFGYGLRSSFGSRAVAPRRPIFQ